MRIRHLLPLFLIPWLFTAAHANPYETTLKNGLRVIVKEGSPRADRRAYGLVPHAGSMDEKLTAPRVSPTSWST